MSIITARYLGPEGNGVIAALTVYPALFMSIGSLGIRQSTAYFVGQEKDSIDNIYGAALSIWVFTSVIAVAACYLLIRFFTKEDYSGTLVFLAIAAIPFSLYNTYASGIFLGKQDIREFNRINWIPAATNLAFTALLVIAIPLGVQGSMIGSLLAPLTMFFFVIWRVRKITNLRLNFDFVLMGKMLRLGVVYAISLLIINLNYKADIILLEKYSDSYQLGIYTKGVTIIQYLWEIPMLLSTLTFSRSAGAKDPLEFSRKVCRLLRIGGIVILLASVVIYFLSDFIIVLLFGERFRESVMVLKLLLPGVLLLTIFKVLNMDVAGKGKPWLSMTAMIPAVIINIVLNIMWIPQYGANGSALSSTISYSVAAILFLFIYSSKVGIPVREIFRYSNEDFSIVRSLLTKLKPNSIGTK
jgi:O-antigen/teichoic acid export membrane protein